MAPTTNDAPAACLMCKADDLKPTDKGVIPEHRQVGTGTAALYCQGAGHTRRYDDGRDELRRYAIVHFVEVEVQRVKAEADALAALQNPTRDAASVTRKEMAELIHWQTLAKLWRNFAIHGRWDYAIKECLRLRVAATNSTSALECAVVEHWRHAAAAWWNKAHLDFLSEFPEGPDHEQFNNMLMGV